MSVAEYDLPGHLSLGLGTEQSDSVLRYLRVDLQLLHVYRLPSASEVARPRSRIADLRSLPTDFHAVLGHHTMRRRLS